MNCHGNNEKNQGKHSHSPLKHMWHMILCCGLPIVVIGLLPVIAKYSPAAGGFLGRVAPLLCPIMMLMMLPMMFRGNKNGSCCDDKTENQDNNKSLQPGKSLE